jgi:hypothetical protein
MRPKSAFTENTLGLKSKKNHNGSPAYSAGKGPGKPETIWTLLKTSLNHSGAGFAKIENQQWTCLQAWPLPKWEVAKPVTPIFARPPLPPSDVWERFNAQWTDG